MCVFGKVLPIKIVHFGGDGGNKIGKCFQGRRWNGCVTFYM